MVYEDELLYSLIARYKFTTFNCSKRSIIMNLFGSKNIIPTIEFPASLGKLSENLPEILGYTPLVLLARGTLFNLYSPFLNDKIKGSLIKSMINATGNDIYCAIGATAGGICKKKALMYCPICAKK
jgi:hypothetical protein